MLLRNLQERATGRRVSGGGGGVPSGTDDGFGNDDAMPASPTTPASPGLPRPAFSRSLAAAADLAPRLRVVATCDGHDGCVNAVSFAGERGERLVTGGDDLCVRVFSAAVSAWEPATSSSGNGGRAPPRSHRALARIRTQHASNVFQAFFVDAADEGSELLTCAADGAVRSLLVPRAQTERLFPGRSGGDTAAAGTAAASAAAATVVESRLLFRHSGRAHKMALVPGGSPSELATCGEDGVVATLDLRERGGGGGGGDVAARPSPVTAAVGPAALAAAARTPGRSCFPPSDRACSRAAPAGSDRNVDVTLYDVSIDPLRPHLLCVGGDCSEMGLGERPAAVVIDRRMLFVPPSEAFHARHRAAPAPEAGGVTGRGRGRGGGGRGGRGRLERSIDDEDEVDEDEEDDFIYSSDDDDGDDDDPAAGTIFARGFLIRQILESSRRAAGRGDPPGTLDAARLPAKCAAVVQGSALPAHLGAFRCGANARRSARRHARFRARGASVTGVAFEPRGRGLLLVTVNSESAVYLVPAAIARGEACAGEAGEDADSDNAGGGGEGGESSSSEEEEESSSDDEEEESSSDEEAAETARDARQRRRREQQREREQRARERQERRALNPAQPPPFPREARPSRSYFHRREDVDDNEHGAEGEKRGRGFRKKEKQKKKAPRNSLDFFFKKKKNSRPRRMPQVFRQRLQERGDDQGR